MRLEKKGHRGPVKVGYGTKAELRGMKNGLVVTTVYNTKELASFDPKTHGIVVGKVGMKKKIEILEAISKHKFTLLTGDADAKAQELKDAFKNKQKEAAEIKKEREAKQKELEKQAKKAEEEEKKANKESEEEDAAEEQKKAEKKEAEKVLTKAR